MNYIKIIKYFIDNEGDRNRFVFYINEDIAWKNLSPEPFFFSYLKLLANSDIVIKNDLVVKNRNIDLEKELFDKFLLEQ